MNKTMIIVHTNGGVALVPGKHPFDDAADIWIGVAFEETNTLVHCHTPQPGPQTEAECRVLADEVLGALARGETRTLFDDGAA